MLAVQKFKALKYFDIVSLNVCSASCRFHWAASILLQLLTVLTIFWLWSFHQFWNWASWCILKIKNIPQTRYRDNCPLHMHCSWNNHKYRECNSLCLVYGPDSYNLCTQQMPDISRMHLLQPWQARFFYAEIQINFATVWQHDFYPAWRKINNNKNSIIFLRIVLATSRGFFSMFNKDVLIQIAGYRPRLVKRQFAFPLAGNSNWARRSGINVFPPEWRGERER